MPGGELRRAAEGVGEATGVAAMAEWGERAARRAVDVERASCARARVERDAAVRRREAAVVERDEAAAERDEALGWRAKHAAGSWWWVCRDEDCRRAERRRVAAAGVVVREEARRQALADALRAAERGVTAALDARCRASEQTMAAREVVRVASEALRRAGEAEVAAHGGESLRWGR